MKHRLIADHRSIPEAHNSISVRRDFIGMGDEKNRNAKIAVQMLEDLHDFVAGA
jgi:hypothetical protein